MAQTFRDPELPGVDVTRFASPDGPRVEVFLPVRRSHDAHPCAQFTPDQAQRFAALLQKAAATEPTIRLCPTCRAPLRRAEGGWMCPQTWDGCPGWFIRNDGTQGAPTP